jgi:hypothetical protein
MGENAKKTWDWHNTVVGAGYQAKGVVRQRVAEEPPATKVVDMRPQATRIETRPAKFVEEKSSKKSSKSSKEKRRKGSDTEEAGTSSRKRAKFNPLLQALSVRLRDNISNI